MKRLFKSKKAVSPVVSTILMIMVVMVGMTVLFAFLASYTSSYQQGSGKAVLESMTVEESWLSNGQATVWVYNIGKTDLTISEVYVNAQKVTPSPNLVVPVGQHMQLTVASPTGSFLAGSSYAFKFVTQRGSSFQDTFIP